MTRRKAPGLGLLNGAEVLKWRKKKGGFWVHLTDPDRKYVPRAGDVVERLYTSSETVMLINLATRSGMRQAWAEGRASSGEDLLRDIDPSTGLRPASANPYLDSNPADSNEEGN